MQVVEVGDEHKVERGEEEQSDEQAFSYHFDGEIQVACAVVVVVVVGGGAAVTVAVWYHLVVVLWVGACCVLHTLSLRSQVPMNCWLRVRGTLVGGNSLSREIFLTLTGIFAHFGVSPRTIVELFIS